MRTTTAIHAVPAPQRRANRPAAAATQEDTQEYLEDAKLRELVGKYSEFINFPIHLYASKQVDREVPADEDADDADADADKDDDKDAEDDVEDAGARPACRYPTLCAPLGAAAAGRSGRAAGVRRAGSAPRRILRCGRPARPAAAAAA